MVILYASRVHIQSNQTIERSLKWYASRVHIHFFFYIDGLFSFVLVQVLDRVRYRVEWIRHQEREKKKLEDEKEKERGETQQLSIKQ